MPESKEGLHSKPDVPPFRDVPPDAPQRPPERLDLFRESEQHEQEQRRQEWSKLLKMEVFSRSLRKTPLSPNEEKVFNQYVDARIRISDSYQKMNPEQLDMIR